MKYFPDRYLRLPLFIMLLIWFNACKQPFTEIQKIEIKNQGSFKFKDELTFLANSINVEMLVFTNPENPKMFYSINNEEAKKVNGDWIGIDSTANFIDFYTSPNKPTNENYRLQLNFGRTDILESSFKMYPNPVADILTFSLDSKSRGIIDIRVFSVTGKEIYFNSDFVSNNSYQHQIVVNGWDIGLYFVIIEFGNSKLVRKVARS